MTTLTESSDRTVPAKERPQRFLDIDIAKGVAIALVVFGHLVARTHVPTGNEWYQEVKGALYTFHMSFFFYLAGYTFFCVEEGKRHSNVLRAVKKMVVAYFLIGAAVYVGKLVAAEIGRVDKPVTGGIEELAKLVMDPLDSYASFLWFVCAVVPMYLVTDALLRFSDRLFLLLFAASAVAHYLALHVGITKLFALDLIGRYAVFFLVARFFVEHRSRVNEFMARFAPLLLALLVGCLFTFSYWTNSTVAAFLGLPALHGIAIHLSRSDGILTSRAGSALADFGKRTFTIYLLNSIVLGVARLALGHVVPWSDWFFVVQVPILLLAGLYGPLLCERVLQVTAPPVARLIR